MDPYLQFLVVLLLMSTMSLVSKATVKHAASEYVREAERERERVKKEFSNIQHNYSVVKRERKIKKPLVVK